MANDRPKDEIHDALIKDVREKQERLKQKNITARDELIAKKHTEELVELQELGISHRDQSGNPVTYADEALQRAEQIIKSGVNNTVDFRSAMMDLLHLYSIGSQAFSHTVATLAVPLIKQKLIEDLILDKFLLGNIDHPYLKYASPTNILGGVGGFLKRAVTGDPEVDLPHLLHDVRLNDEDELEIDSLLRSDNVPGGGTLDNLFKAGVVKWLDDCGYKPVDASNKKFRDASGSLLTKEQFEELRDDPDNGLDQYLRGSSSVSFAPKI